jgi:hypothetical protein
MLFSFGFIVYNHFILDKGGFILKTYKLTVFEKNGQKLLDQSFEAFSDEEAKSRGSQLLQEHACEEKTYRCTSLEGKLLLFHT